MEKDYLKKFIDLGGNEFLAYDQFRLSDEEREAMRASFEGSADEEPNVG